MRALCTHWIWSLASRDERAASRLESPHDLLFIPLVWRALMAIKVDADAKTRLHDEPMAVRSWPTLDADANVHFDADACLRLRPASTNCSACSDVCPVAAFEWLDEGVRVTSGCMGCGRCAPACPTHALSVRGFAATPTASTPVRIECNRVPAELRGTALAVPCLGGVGKERLLELTAAAAGGPVMLVDRGWCRSCKAGGERSTLGAAVDEAKAQLQDIDYPQTGWPQVEQRETPTSKALPLRSARDTQPVSRRRFFAAFGSRVLDAANAVTHRPLAASAQARLPSPTIRSAQERQLRVLQTLASQAGAPVPKVVYPQISVSAACDNATICAAACPSGALATYLGEDGSTGLEFVASQCVACGICVERCPSKAVRMAYTGESGVGVDRVPQRLTRFTSLRCPHCGARYVRVAADSGCPACAIQQALVASIVERGA